MVAIGVSEKPAQHLVFFLDHVETECQSHIAHWAEKRGVPIDFKVVGQFRPLI